MILPNCPLATKYHSEFGRVWTGDDDTYRQSGVLAAPRAVKAVPDDCRITLDEEPPTPMRFSIFKPEESWIPFNGISFYSVFRTRRIKQTISSAPSRSTMLLLNAQHPVRRDVVAVPEFQASGKLER